MDERQQAIEYGRRLGEEEDERRELRDGRHANRAAAYAAWRWDFEHGIETPWVDYCKEFKIKPAGG